MKVAIIMPLAEQRGGGELMLLHLMQQGRELGIEWLVIFLQDGPMVSQLQSLGVDTRVVQVGRLRQVDRFIRSVVQIASLVRREGAELILGWMGYGHLYGSVTALLSGLPSVWY